MELHGEEKLSKLSQLKPGTLSIKDDGSLSVIRFIMIGQDQYFNSSVTGFSTVLNMYYS